MAELTVNASFSGSDDWCDFSSTSAQESFSDKNNGDLVGSCDIDENCLKLENLLTSIETSFKPSEIEVNFGCDHPFINDNVKDTWNDLLDINDSNCLNFKWDSSDTRRTYLNVLNVKYTTKDLEDARFSSIYDTSSDEDVPKTKKQSLIKQSSSASSDLPLSEINLNVEKQQQCEENKEETVESSLIEFKDLGLNDKPTTNRVQNTKKENIKSSQYLILDGVMDDYNENFDVYPLLTQNIEKTKPKSNNNFSQQALKILDQLPNLNFMKSKVVLLPVKKEKSTHLIV